MAAVNPAFDYVDLLDLAKQLHDFATTWKRVAKAEPKSKAKRGKKQRVIATIPGIGPVTMTEDD